MLSPVRGRRPPRAGRFFAEDVAAWFDAASRAVMSGENLPLVGKLLGRRRRRTTAGYAHPADGRLVEAADKVGAFIARAHGWYGAAARRSAIEAPPRRRLRQDLTAPQARRALGPWSKAGRCAARLTTQ